ncbi:D123 domain-containing protein, putative [Bodo saltans]|uniref:D123 domain-containing protein, putative n=1 Tax=Bodo saltans TaxID=75058 RepID=A0A0S4KHQ7_BODSA|nr:D123 domain-containing protein, putative [Bodo saltans]|eukprot:CUI14659.1 D123 domain-containing protein, putative [Bodo saltans]
MSAEATHEIAPTRDNFSGGSLFDCDENEADVGQSPSIKVCLSITSFPVSHVREHDKVLYNTNNHQDYEVDPERPNALQKRADGKRRLETADYAAKLEQCRTEHWVDEFHSHYRVINIPRHHLQWMKTASVVACQKAGVSPAFVEDIEDAVQTIGTGNTFSSCVRELPETGYFVRTSTVSLKDGVHGVGPYYGLKEILESTVTARMGHQGVDGATSSLKYFLFPWISNLHRHREFRVFVCKKRVTAISQQSLYDPNTILSTLKDPRDVATVIQNWCRRLLPYINNVVIPKITWMDEFVMDIVLLGPIPSATSTTSADVVDLTNPEKLVPYFIETNPFGFAYSSGSSLFHWVNDYAELYGISTNSDSTGTTSIAFRYTAQDHVAAVALQVEL